MLFKHRLKPEQGELELIGDILTIIDTNPDKGLLIKNFSKYFLNFVKNSQFEFTITNDNTHFFVGCPTLRLWPEKKWHIEIEYWRASEYVPYCNINPKNYTQPRKNQYVPSLRQVDNRDYTYATLALIHKIEDGILVPLAVARGFLTKEQYLDALYERLAVLEGKDRENCGLLQTLR